MTQLLILVLIWGAGIREARTVPGPAGGTDSLSTSQSTSGQVTSGLLFSGLAPEGGAACLSHLAVVVAILVVVDIPHPEF